MDAAGDAWAALDAVRLTRRLWPCVEEPVRTELLVDDDQQAKEIARRLQTHAAAADLKHITGGRVSSRSCVRTGNGPELLVRQERAVRLEGLARHD